MIEEQAQVLQVENNQALIEIYQQSSCGSCSQQGSCGTSSLSQLFGKRPTQFSLDIPQNTLHQGDLIIVGLDEMAYLKASVLIYLIPLFCLFAAALIGGNLLSLNDFAVAVLAFMGLLLGFKWAQKLSAQSNRQLTPQFVKKI